MTLTQSDKAKQFRALHEAPGLADLEAVRAVFAAVGKPFNCAVGKPFNCMVAIKGKSFTVAALAAAGVKPISLTTPARIAANEEQWER